VYNSRLSHGPKHTRYHLRCLFYWRRWRLFLRTPSSDRSRGDELPGPGWRKLYSRLWRRDLPLPFESRVHRLSRVSGADALEPPQQSSRKRTRRPGCGKTRIRFAVARHAILLQTKGKYTLTRDVEYVANNFSRVPSAENLVKCSICIADCLYYQWSGRLHPSGFDI